MENKIISVGNLQIDLRVPARPDGKIVYLHSHDARFSPAAVGETTVAVITGVDWNRELTPWRADKVFRGGENFGGESEKYLARLVREVVPEVEKAAGFVPSCRIIAGYSLAGLFALWSACVSSEFDRAASVSGSLWYDGFAEWLEKTEDSGFPERVYLSLGDGEHQTANVRMAKVREQTERIAALLRGKGVEVAFELNRGGHFDDVEGRINRALAKICF